MSIRPPKPRHFLRKQLELVARYSALRADRLHEILAQLPVPIGFFGAITYLSDTRTPRTVELMMTAFRLAVFVEMRFKHAFAVPRPIDHSPQIHPVIPTPLHSAFPSGHATEAFIMARVLSAVLAAAKDNYDEAPWKEQLMLLANRIAVNRTVAGVHFPVDSMAGCILGLALGDYLIARGKSRTGSYCDWDFNGVTFSEKAANQDFEWRPIEETISAHDDAPQLGLHTARSHSVAGSPALMWLWQEAVKEWTHAPSVGDRS